jgi:hypothetical protein
MQLRAWLNHPKRDFDIGVKLYNEYIGKSDIFKYKNSFTEKKLYEALKQYDEVKLNKSPLRLPNPAPPPPPNNQTAKPILPAEIVRLNDLKLETFKKMAALHQHLCTIKGNSQKSMDSRLKLQQEIMRLDELNAECWEKIIYWEENGKLPVEKDGFAIGDKTIRELAQLEKAIPTYITKLNKELDTLGDDDKKRIAITKRIADWHMQYRSIKDSIDKLPTLKQIKEALSGTN